MSEIIGGYGKETCEKACGTGSKKTTRNRLAFFGLEFKLGIYAWVHMGPINQIITLWKQY
jgi:hypothetical protein